MVVAESRSAAQVLGASLVLGVLGEILFNGAALGANISLFAIAVACGALLLSKKIREPIPKAIRSAAPFFLLFSLCFAVREAPELKLLNGAAIFLLLGAMLVRRKKGGFALSSLSDLTINAVGAWFNLTRSFAELIVKEIRWVRNEQDRARIRAVVRGGALATPFLVIFGTLFASADEAFSHEISSFLSFRSLDGGWMVRAAVTFMFCLVLAAGSYRVMLLEKKEYFGPPRPPVISRPSLGFTEVAVILGSLNALFAAFVMVQVEYFFGGTEHVRRLTSLTYAEYARHGFFELTAVAFCSIATIIGLHLLLTNLEEHRKSFSILGGTFVVLVSVILVSAFQRMSLYIDFAGLTQLRVYTSAFMAWISLLLIWLAATVLLGNPNRFAFGALTSGLATIFLLNMINPDATIARFNLSKPNRVVDISYLETLSIDAAPAVISGSDALPAQTANQLKDRLRVRWSNDVDGDWRGTSYSRMRYLGRYRHQL